MILCTYSVMAMHIQMTRLSLYREGLLSGSVFYCIQRSPTGRRSITASCTESPFFRWKSLSIFHLQLAWCTLGSLLYRPSVHDPHSTKHYLNHSEIKLVVSHYHIYPRSSNSSDHSALHPFFTQRSISSANHHLQSWESILFYTDYHNVRNQVDPSGDQGMECVSVL